MSGHKETGYTLIELLVVLGILGLIAAFAVPVTTRALQGATLRSDARRLVSELRHLQHAAMERQQIVRVHFGSEADTPDPLPQSAITLSAGESLTVLGPERELLYYPDGTASGGTVEISNGDRKMDVDIAWLTGAPAVRAVP